MDRLTTPDGTIIEIAALDSLIERVTNVWQYKFVPEYLQDHSRYMGFSGWHTLEIDVNPYTLVEAIGNAREDLIRWCMFHLANSTKEDRTERPDHHKYAAFLARWIAKERPIFLICKSKRPVNIPEQLYRLNAFFAATVMQDYLDYAIPPELAEEFAYMLHFRDERAETYALLAYCAEQISRASGAPKQQVSPPA